MKSYYAKEKDHYINYLFKKDMSYTRLKNTTKMINTIVYTKEQLDIVRKLHPQVVSILYNKITIDEYDMSLNYKLN